MIPINSSDRCQFMHGPLMWYPCNWTSIIHYCEIKCCIRLWILLWHTVGYKFLEFHKYLISFYWDMLHWSQVPKKGQKTLGQSCLYLCRVTAHQVLSHTKSALNTFFHNNTIHYMHLNNNLIQKNRCKHEKCPKNERFVIFLPIK